jgi:formate hydrogenlyase subunit 6/NADH:ubiquinone oxidoreductase subunit I
MKYPKIRELVEAVKALVVGPYTVKFPRKAVEPAKRFRGKPEYSDEGCIACKACLLVCPARAIESKDIVTPEKATRKMVLHLDECHYCGQCSALCTTRDDRVPGIKHTTKFDLAGYDRSSMVSETREKELALCEICGDVITARAHLEWLVKKLGPLAYANPTLFLSSLRSMALSADVAAVAKDAALTRDDRLKLLCARCRRQTTIERF